MGKRVNVVRSKADGRVAMRAAGRWRLCLKQFFNQRGAHLSAADYHRGSAMLVAAFSNGIFDLYQASMSPQTCTLRICSHMLLICLEYQLIAALASLDGKRGMQFDSSMKQSMSDCWVSVLAAAAGLRGGAQPERVARAHQRSELQRAWRLGRAGLRFFRRAPPSPCSRKRMCPPRSAIHSADVASMVTQRTTALAKS